MRGTHFVAGVAFVLTGVLGASEPSNQVASSKANPVLAQPDVEFGAVRDVFEHPAAGGTLYVVRETDNWLVSIDVDTLAFTDVGPLGISFDFGGLAYDGNSGTLWAIGGRPDPSVYTVDMNTGAATFVGSHGISDMFGLAFDTSTDTLYGATFTGGGDLYELSQTNGSASFIGSGSNRIGGLAYDGGNDQLVGINDGGGDLYAIDRSNGSQTLLWEGPFTDNSGLAWDAMNNYFWDIDWSGNLIYFEIDNAYNRVDVLAGLGSHDGMAWVGEDAGGDVEMYLDGSRISNPEGCAEFCCLFNGDPLQNYQEDGLTIDVDDIHFRFTPCNFTDEHYYPNGGINERISITRTDGNDFGHVEFEVSHGFAGCDVSLWMTPYLNGVPQGQFTADVTAGALIGFEGIFDEVLVGSYADPATRDQMNEANLNAVVLDNVCFDSGAGDDCLTMVVSTLIANAPADWVVCGATPDVEVAVVYGFRPGNTSINGFAGYCADFGIDGVNQNKVVCRKKADGSGCITCRVGSLPARPGTRILTQAAMKGTCPDPCMSNLDDQIVQ